MTLTSTGSRVIRRVMRSNKQLEAGYETSVVKLRNSVKLNASYFLTGKDYIMLNPIFGILRSRAIQNIPDMIGYL